MGATTGISWTDHTFNPWWGCAKVSAGCANCYAETFSKRTGHDIWGPGKARRTFGAKHWAAPLAWNAAAEKAGKRARVFCASMADVFEDHPTADAERQRLWALIKATPWLDWQLLTKRPERIAENLPADWGAGYQNVWLGTSVESQSVVWRVAALVSVPARLRFLSCEPLLGPLDLRGTRGIHWLIVGGESGPGYRPMDKDWARSLRDWSAEVGVAFFYKQDGGLRPGHGDLDGVLIQEFPGVA